jgi:hypothetical protein
MSLEVETASAAPVVTASGKVTASHETRLLAQNGRGMGHRKAKKRTRSNKRGNVASVL